MRNEILTLQRKAEQHRREMQNAHAQRLKDAAAELASWLDAKTAEVDHLASQLRTEEQPIPTVHEA